MSILRALAVAWSVSSDPTARKVWLTASNTGAA